jgi:cation transport ATPase
MSSSDNTKDITGPLVKMPRPFNHRDYLSERRQQILQQKQTDMLPSLPADSAHTKFLARQVIAMREENMQLRSHLAEIEAEMDALQRDREMESEHVRDRFQDVLTGREVLQEAYVQLEQRYNELYKNFQNAIEEEAFKMVTEATHTLKLSYDEPPTTRNDAKKTVELYVRQAEDRQTAHTLYLMRQAQRKAARLEEELELERQHIAEENEKLHTLQESVRDQAELRRRTLEAHLRAKFSVRFALAAASLLIVLYILQIVCLLIFHFPLTSLTLFALVVPILLGIIVAALIAHFRSTWRDVTSHSPHKQAMNS